MNKMRRKANRIKSVTNLEIEFKMLTILHTIRRSKKWQKIRV